MLNSYDNYGIDGQRGFGFAVVFADGGGWGADFFLLASVVLLDALGVLSRLWRALAEIG